jgi:hypothetical protein
MGFVKRASQDRVNQERIGRSEELYWSLGTEVGHQCQYLLVRSGQARSELVWELEDGVWIWE